MVGNRGPGPVHLKTGTVLGTIVPVEKMSQADGTKLEEEVTVSSVATKAIGVVPFCAQELECLVMSQ